MNKIIITGNIGRDAEAKEINGRAVINVIVATSKKYVQNGEQKEKTTWFDVAYWMPKIEGADKLASYLLKGSKIAVEGEADSRAWKDNAGEPKSTNLITASNLEIISSTKEKNSTSSAPPPSSESYNTKPGEDDDLPF